jgi:hypothetical protein
MMASEFEQDRDDALAAMEEARADLHTFVEGLAEADLKLARRGGWDIATVIEHIVESEWHYAGMALRLQERAPDPEPKPETAIDSVAAARAALRQSRQALLASVEGVGEEAFYRLGKAGGQGYSVLSVLENVRQHDLEHGAQLQQIRGTAGRSQPA